MEKSIFSAEQKTLVNLLRQKRLAANLTQAELAGVIGEPQSFVSKYESGERRLDIIEIRHVCHALGMSLIEFVTRLEESLQ